MQLRASPHFREPGTAQSDTVPRVASADTAEDAQVISEVLEALVSAVEQGVPGKKEAAAETAPDACDNSSISAEGGNDAAQQLARAGTAETAQVISAVLADLVSAVEQGVAGDKAAAETALDARDDSSTDGLSTERGNDTAQQLAGTDTEEIAQVISAVLADLVSAVEQGVAGEKEAAAETAPDAGDSSSINSISVESENDAALQLVATKPMRCKFLCK